MDLDNFDISLGIRKNNKFITIKQDNEKSNKILIKHKDNIEKLKKENKDLEKEIEKLKNIQLFIDFTDIEFDNLSNKIDSDNNDYNIDDITLNEKEDSKIRVLKKTLHKELIKCFKEKENNNKKLINKIKILKKSLHKELLKKFKKKPLDIIIEIKNIYNTIQNSIYDDLILCYDDKLQINKYCNLLKLDIKNENLLLDYFMNDIFNKDVIDKLKLNELDNSYKTIKSIAKYLKLSVVLLDSNLELIDELYVKSRNKLYFMLFNNNIYAIDHDFDIFYKFKMQVLTSINSCLFRDKEKNSSFVLFNELDNYQDYFIFFPKLKYSTFKYQYLLNDLYLKKIGNLTFEQVNILKYIVQNFGLHFYLLNDLFVLRKNEFTLEFINNHQDYAIDNISLFDYNYYNKSKNNELVHQDDYKTYEDFDYYYTYNNAIIKGITKQEIYDKCYNKYNIHIELDEIKKNFSYASLKNIKSQNELDAILSLFPNVDNLVFFNCSNKKILSIEKMNFDNPITFDYIYKLSESIKECRLCKCKLSINRKDSNLVSIDAINPLLGHTINNNNIDLLCGKCNIVKGTSFLGNYHDKPYFYDINTLKQDKLIEILKYHKLDTNGITPILRKRLEKYITLIN